MERICRTEEHGNDGTSTNVGRHKRWTVQTSDQYKRRTGTNVGQVHL